MVTIGSDVVSLPDDVLLYENDKFYNFVREYVGDIEAEILKVQRIKNARLLLRVPDVFSFFGVDCEDFVALKKQACFVVDSTHFIVKSGIRFNIEYFIELMRSKQSSALNNNTTIPSQTATSKFTKEINQSLNKIMDAFNDRNSTNESKPFVYAFIDNILKNLNRSKNHYEYNPFVQKFASALHVLAGTNTYEYLRINLPGALPTITTLENYNRNIDLRLHECQFRFDSMKKYLHSLDSEYIFAVSFSEHFAQDKSVTKVFF